MKNLIVHIYYCNNDDSEEKMSFKISTITALMFICIIYSACMNNPIKITPDDILLKEKAATYQIELEKMVQEYHLPSLSVVVIKDKKFIYSRGFGYSDNENKIIATDKTPYQIASVTKPIAATVFLGLSEQGIIDLHGKMKDYYPEYVKSFDEFYNKIKENYPDMMHIIENYHYKTEDITIWHHLTHTSEGKPGERFKYNGFLYSILSKVVDAVSKKDFRTIVSEDIIKKLNMENSLSDAYDTSKPEVLKNLAKPYIIDEKGNAVLNVNYKASNLGAGGGIISTVLDLAKFDSAYDSDELISQNSKEYAFTPAKSNDGKTLPYGIGWFIGNYRGHKVVYHTGWDGPAYSALYLKVLDSNLTLILLSNCQELIAPFMEELGKGNIEYSPFAKAFLDIFLQ
jgi:CubicO group peptidase (beta-lactamase class C family)